MRNGTVIRPARTGAGVNCVLLGAGGHARVLIECLQADPSVRICGILDADAAGWGQQWCGIPILGGDEELDRLSREEITHFVIGLGATGDCRLRRRLYERCVSKRFEALTVTHPSSICSRSAVIGEGCQLMARCVVGPGARLGRNALINTGAIVEHDCVIGDHAHVASGATLSGGVVVGQEAHIGAGAVVKQGIHIAEGAIIGAGAAVVRDIPEYVVAVGVPARILKSRNGR